MTVRSALTQGVKLLEDAAVSVPRLTAEVLLAHALRRERAYLYGHPEHELTEVEWIHYGRYLHERIGGKPTQYITRRQEFYGREFHVTPDVLIPRPETEHVVETVLSVARRAPRMLDVGCGSGALAITLQLETGAEVWATDVSLPALQVAAGNARRLGAAVQFLACDLASAFASQSLDVVVSNPPYVPLSDGAGLQREVRDFEPRLALFAGPTGFEIYERLVPEAARVLLRGGWLVLELGYNSHNRVREMLGAMWGDVQVAPDLAGIPRVLAARFRGETAPTAI
jgi:release factor glutamine methyltransferase